MHPQSRPTMELRERKHRSKTATPAHPEGAGRTPATGRALAERQRHELVAALQRHIVESPRELSEAELVQLARSEAQGVLSDVEVLAVLRALRYESSGVGPLESTLRQPGVTDVLVNGTHGVWFDRGRGLERANVSFADDHEVRRLATRLLVGAGSRLDDAQCFANGRLHREDGTALRVHAILSPPAEQGTCLSLRVLRQAAMGIDGLVETGTFDASTAQTLRSLIAARRSFLVVGGTGSGKTTLLSALLGEVSRSERIICIEDTPELRPRHQHVLTLVAREANAEGAGRVTMAALLQQALRMRPDRIVIGEIRGPEVADLLAAMNTGHEGCAGTVHANSIAEVPARIEALAALGGLAPTALHAQLAAAHPVVLVMRRERKGRRLSQIGELVGNPVQARVLWDESQHSSCVLDWGK